MSLTDEQIEAMFSKEIKSKTLMVDLLNLDKVISDYQNDGWTLKNKIEVNGRYKVTFIKVH